VLPVQGLTRRYGDLVALDDLSFTVAEGQTLELLGPNGTGKTTAMRIVLAVLAPNAGADGYWRTRCPNASDTWPRTTAIRFLHCSLVSQENERRRLGHGGSLLEGGWQKLSRPVRHLAVSLFV